MKNYILAAIMVMVGTIGAIGSAEAASRYCRFNPEDPRCYAPPPPPRDFGYDDPFYDDSDIPLFDDGFDRPRPRRHPREDGGTITLQFGSGQSCNAIAQSLKRSGFRRVNAVDCAGRDYAFTAVRDGERMKIWVKSATGRISSIRPY
jgi:hypothetical protein